MKTISISRRNSASRSRQRRRIHFPLVLQLAMPTPIRTWIRHGVFVILVAASLASCRKDNELDGSATAIKIIPTQNEPSRVKLIASNSGTMLAWITSGDLVSPALRQELFLLSEDGKVKRSLQLSDTVFQYMSAVKGIDEGFVICATSNTNPYIAVYHLNDSGDIIWSRTFVVKFGTNLNEPAINTTLDNHYMVMYQSYGSGYYLWKGDVNGDEIFNKKCPTPNAVHAGSGLNFGEKYVNFFQANDTLIIIQGILYDEYDRLVENCFLRALDADVHKLWYSSNFDSTKFENGVALAVINNKIVLFGSSAENEYAEYAGDVFGRHYSTTGDYEGETHYPRIEGTPNNIRSVTPTPDGGYLLTGSNNQYLLGELVSNNNIILIKLDAQANLTWSKSIRCEYPSKGYGAVVHPDGTIGLLGFLKERHQTNKLIYLHLDASGNLILN